MNPNTRKRLLVLLAAAGTCTASAQTTAPNAATPAAADEETIVLSPFEVSSARDTGYQASQTLAGTRIRTDLRDVGSAISVVTRDFLNDVGATDTTTLLQYTTNAEVAGTRGTYAGLGNAGNVDETTNLRNPTAANRVRGLSNADQTRDFFVTDIPWDSYNVDRIDIQRGPNSILFGLGSPAGIVNASTRMAEFRNLGSAEFRFGSYGSTRASLDLNQELIDDVLAIRVDGLWNNEKFRQKPAFQEDTRVYTAIRFDPQLFNRRDFRTSLKARYEHGDIDANRPRIVPPYDSVSPWYRPVNNTSMMGGMGKLEINNGYGLGSVPQNTNPWLSAATANQQQPIWFIDGTTDQTYRIYGGYVNTGARNANGTDRGSSGNLVGQRYSDMFFNVTSLPAFAANANLPGNTLGQYRSMSLTDASIFDFYNILIDGDTKYEYEKWDAYNIDLSQTGWDDRVGLQFTYDRQLYKRGGEALLGTPGSAQVATGTPTISIDILRNFQDLSANPNFGRPFVVGGPGRGDSYESDRKYVRTSLFAELRASDYFQNDFWVKLLGKQRFNGVYSNEHFNLEQREFRMYAHSREWAGYWNRNDGGSVSFQDRPPVAVIYLGGPINARSTASGANIPGISAPVQLQDGTLYYFDSTWKNTPGVNFSDPWTVPSNLAPMFDATTLPSGQTGFLQNSNPANYVGWNANLPINLVRYNEGENQSLTTKAQKSLRVTESYAGSWQGYFWNNAIIPTFGWRYDEVRGKNVSATPVTANRSYLNLQPDVYRLPAGFPANQIYKDHSLTSSAVVHLNRLLPRDPLPIDVSLSYSKSDNFQITDVRRNIYGTPLPNPTGKTTDYGVTIGTKDGKYTFRAVRYESSVANASTPLDLTGLANTITQGLKFRNVFLYRMSGYDWPSREQTDMSVGRRYFWTPAYLDANGRPVADLNGNPTPPAGATLETQAEADLHRDASIRAWNAIQTNLAAKGFFTAWGYTPTTASALTDRATYEATLVGNNPASQYMPDPATLASYTAIAPQGLTVTSDTESEGYEFELTANPLPNWRISVNASKGTAVRSNVGGEELADLVAYMDTQIAGVAGDMRQFNGTYVRNNEVRQNYSQWRANYTLLKLQEGSLASELRKWRYNVVTNYDFRNGIMKGVGVGGAYRWQDKAVIGYPVITANGTSTFDLNNPYYGPSEDAIDLWLSYTRKLTKKLDWKIQLNIRNAFADSDLIPISIEPDGKTWAAARIAPVQEWVVTNTFSF